ncbi:three-Cys-motif partner protein TcmP [uncultured Brachyspira sp.]|uniref:three-Cys-motif partner protein TcmP n=1 Tax=uncultured Brachyspira sp. TaxID=221953 RepID=UPI00260F6546|nr:three-Cys-motif partner protein TcmP [uncultured Brachyspira sp.]
MSQKNEDFFKEQKPWSKTKNDLLKNYLKPYFSKILHTKKKICYIDCFAGKGVFEDGSCGSPLLALDTIYDSINRAQINSIPDIECYFIELNHAEDLTKNLAKYKNFHSNVNIYIIDGAFETNILSILKKKQDYNIFLYIDPYGIKALDSNIFIEISRLRLNSIEFLINFNSFGFFREACRVSSIDVVEDKKVNINKELEEYDMSKNIQVEELNKIAFGDYWIKTIKDYNKHKNASDAEEDIINNYKLCIAKYYKYIIEMPIKLNRNYNTKYRLVHITNHQDGCVLMAENMLKRSSEHKKSVQNKGQLNIEDYFSMYDDVVVCSTNNDEVIYSLDNKEIQSIIIENTICDLLNNKRYYLTELHATLYSNLGVTNLKEKVKNILIKLKNDGTIQINRTPKYTKSGKPTEFWEENRNNKILLEINNENN